MLSPEELQAGLAQFTGTETWYRYRFGQETLAYYTDGVKYLTNNAECYWLLMEIVSAQVEANVHKEPFQTWELLVDENRRATLTCEDGNRVSVFTKVIQFTDFPLEEIKLWVEYGEIEGANKPIVLLPSEH
ncbi:MAG: hypothetical protein F6J95_003575 [Leptolyngbya sp. SIO1E4]|nr:hypothetical protein [Leptolyngbya sp. SIO1E4]